MELRDSKYGKFWGCSQFPNCRGTHGAHPDGRPLGVPADAVTKAARIQAHAAFDGLWKSGHMRRRDAYTWLSRQLGIPTSACHIGTFDRQRCLDVVRVCEHRHGWGSREYRHNILHTGRGSGELADLVSVEDVDPYWGH